MIEIFNSLRYQELLKKQGKRYLKLSGHLWTIYQRMVVPVGPVNQVYSVSVEDAQRLLKYFRKAILVRATTGFIDSPNQWYCVISNKHNNSEEMTSKEGRKKVKLGLKNCRVSRIDVQFMAKHAWPIFFSAFGRYKNTRLTMTKTQFQKSILISGFDDIIHYWGVFDKKSEKLIGYIQNFLYGTTEVNYGDLRFHPAYLHLYSSYALFYEMSRYYLVENKFSFVNDGFRSLLHDTNIQKYLIEKFLFKKQPVGLKIHYRPFIGHCVSLTYPYRHLLGKLYEPLAALYRLEEIDRKGTMQ